jgi:hypothetical protein
MAAAAASQLGREGSPSSWELQNMQCAANHPTRVNSQAAASVALGQLHLGKCRGACPCIASPPPVGKRGSTGQLSRSCRAAGRQVYRTVAWQGRHGQGGCSAAAQLEWRQRLAPLQQGAARLPTRGHGCGPSGKQSARYQQYATKPMNEWRGEDNDHRRKPTSAHKKNREGGSWQPMSGGGTL